MRPFWIYSPPQLRRGSCDMRMSPAECAQVFREGREFGRLCHVYILAGTSAPRHLAMQL